MPLRLLMLLIILPMVAVAGYFAYAQLSIQVQARSEARHALLMSSENTFVSDLIHELQKERGYSAGHVASQGRNFVSELAEQRNESDLRLGVLRARTAQIQALYQAEFTEVLNDLTGLSEMRGRVDGIDVTVSQLAAYYTSMIQALLYIQFDVASAINDPELYSVALGATYVGFAKEAAGLERAMGATALGRGTASVGLFTRFVRLQRDQQTYLDVAGHVLKRPSFDTDLLGATEAVVLQPIRDNISLLVSGADPAYTAPIWFTRSTAWIDHLRGVEANLVRDSIAVGERLAATAEADLRQAAVVAGLTLALVLALAIGNFEYMILRVKRLTGAMESFTEGDFNVQIPGIKGRDEIGHMARATYRFKQETLAMRRRAAEEKADDEAKILGKAKEVVDLVTDGLGALAKADLTRIYGTPLAPEYDSIRTDLNAATERLRRVLIEIARTASGLGQSARDLDRNATDLRRRSNEQSSTVRETAERVNDLSDAMGTLGSDMRKASEMAGSAKTTADESSEVVQSAVHAMDRIAQSSDRIAQIISIIDDIAFQTNLLALNAGVEAARAGETGRGFAVVAQEVGALAQRSSQAASEIKALIVESGRHVSDGVASVGGAGDALRNIFEQITSVSEMIDGVSATSQEHISSLRDVTDAISRVNDLADENTQMADSTRTSSSATLQSSQSLSTLISDFSLGDGAQKDGQAPAQAKPAAA